VTIYWKKNDIPEWAAMSEQERQTAIKVIIRKVWGHWQVYLPFAIQLSVFLAFIFLGPQFEYRLIVVGVLAYLTAKLAGLPFHSYLRKYLIEYQVSAANEGRANKGQ
jgi:hypothetical protein